MGLFRRKIPDIGRNLSMQIIEKSIAEIKPYEKNPRKNDEAVEYVANSIKEFGFKVPIVIGKNGVIVAGHTRYKAAQELGLEKLPCIIADDLTEEQVKAFRIADNKVGEFAEWDFDLLGEELDGIFDIDMSDFGFELNLDENEPQEIEEDEVPEEVETRCKLGDIWQLGEHFLICGDSTDPAVIDRLMDGVKADMVFTDPPYGVNYEGGVIHGNKINTEHKREKLKNDDVDIYGGFIRLLGSVIEDGAIYIFYATRNSYELFKPLKENGIEIHSIIIWNKINTGYADMNSHYKNKYEPCVYACRKGHSLNWHGGTSECTVWDINKDRDNKLHPTQKPIELPAKAIHNSSKKGDVVLDFFGGSGSTLIACEQLNRKCYTVELDPHYCDVIISRWENFTGKAAVKVS